jgi:hypothetical protein
LSGRQPGLQHEQPGEQPAQRPQHRQQLERTLPDDLCMLAARGREPADRGSRRER